MGHTGTEPAPRGSKIITFLKFLFFLGLGILIIWLSLKNLTSAEKTNILNAFRTANYNWVIFTIVLGLLSHLIRALRWRLFLDTMGYHPSLKNTFYAVMIGYFANLAFPRLGEVTRCGILKRYEKIPFHKSFGTVITERTLDLLIFVGLFFIMLFSQIQSIQGYLNTKVYPNLNGKLASYLSLKSLLLLLLLVSLLSLMVFFIFRKKIEQTRLYQKSITLAQGFWQGLKSLSQIKHPWLFTFYSLSIWVLYFFMLYFLFYCFPETSSLGPGSGLSALVLGSVGIMITPGGIGLYPAIIQETLMLYGVVNTTGLALGWIAWTAQTAMILVVGGLSLLLLSFHKTHHGKS